jgi:1-acyl-sn-glycerol-3-phosphate acyltransferase
MPYKHGRPIVDISLPFRIATAMTFYVVWPIAQVVNVMMLSTRYKHTEKLRGFKRAVLVSNHTAVLDPVSVSGAVFPYRTWQTLLESTVESPFVGTLTRLLGGVPLPRGRYGLRSLAESGEILFKYRKFLHFYPEGECFFYNQQIREFKPGAFWVAAELDIPVIPLVTIHAPGPFKPYSFFGRSLPKETLVVLDAVYPATYVKRNEKGELNPDSVRSFAEAVRGIMQAEINKQGGTQAFYRGKMERLKGING